LFKSKLPTAAESIPAMLKAWSSMSSRKSGTPTAFSISGEAVPNASVGSEHGLMPLICWHADSIYRFAMGGRSLGIKFRTAPKALTGFAVDLRHVEKPLSEVLCFVVEAIEDIYKNSPANALAKGAVDVQDLVHRFKAELQSAREMSLAAGTASPTEKPLAINP